MTRNHRVHAFSLIAGLILPVLAAAPVQAALVQWWINPSQSKLTLSIPDTTVNFDGTSVTIRVRNQATSTTVWNTGNTAFLGGFLNTDYDMLGGTIQFLNNPVGQVYGINSGNYRPNPASFNAANTNVDNPDGQYADATQAPAVFGGRIRSQVSLLNNDGGFFTIDDVSYDMTSGVKALSGPPAARTFPAAGLNFGILEAAFSFDGLALPLGLGQPIPDMLDEPFTNLMGLNTSAGLATIVTSGFVSQMTIPLSVPFQIDVGGTFLNASLTGSLVAYVMPEPSSLGMSLAAVGMLAAAGWRKRRKLGRRPRHC